jgi:hypothetical protein
MSILDALRRQLLGQAAMMRPGQGMGGATQGLIGTGGQLDFNAGLLSNNLQNSMGGNSGSGGLNIPPLALLGSAIYSQGVQGKDPFAALLPAYGSAQAIESAASKTALNRAAIKKSKTQQENLKKLMDSDLISDRDKMFLSAGLTIPKTDSKLSTFTKDAINAGFPPGSPEYQQMFVQNYSKSKGLNIDFNPDGSIAAITQGGSPDISSFTAKEGFKDAKLAKTIQSDFGILQTNIKRLQSEIPNTPTGAYGSFVSGINVFADQFSQFKDFAIDSKFANRASKEAEEYLDTKGITKDAQQRAKVKSSIINLSYLLAKIAEPGNPKYSEGDIKRQLDRINWGGSRDQIMAGLQRILEEEYVTASAEFKKYNPEGDFGYEDPFKGIRKKQKKDEIDDPFGLRT